MLGQEQDGETSSKKNGGKTGKQKSDDQGCLIQLFTGESDLKKNNCMVVLHNFFGVGAGGQIFFFFFPNQSQIYTELL